jgi:c-di-GMP-binding flagellar brake protein YcgR
MWEGVDRRKFPRVNYPCLVIIRKDHKEPEAMLTHTENLGLGGICVILKKNLGLFTPVELEIDLMDTQSHIKCEGRVVWVVKRKETQEKKPSFFDTGVEFVNMKDSDKKRVFSIVEHLTKF